MQFLHHGTSLVDLMPYKGNPELWWDGKDNTKLYKWEDLEPVSKQRLVNSTYIASKISVIAKTKGTVS